MDGFPQNHCRKRFGAAHFVPGATASSVGFVPTSAVSVFAELPLRPESGEVVEDCSQHPAENSRQPFLCSPFYNIVSVRLVSGA